MLNKIQYIMIIVVIGILSACAPKRSYPQPGPSATMVPTRLPPTLSPAEIQARQAEAEIVETIIAEAYGTVVPEDWDYSCRDEIRDSGFAFSAEVQLELFQSAMPEQRPDIKTSWANLAHPQCSNQFHGLVLRWMDSVIAYGGDGTPELMVQANDVLIAINTGSPGK